MHNKFGVVKLSRGKELNPFEAKSINPLFKSISEALSVFMKIESIQNVSPPPLS